MSAWYWRRFASRVLRSGGTWPSLLHRHLTRFVRQARGWPWPSAVVARAVERDRGAIEGAADGRCKESHEPRVLGRLPHALKRDRASGAGANGRWILCEHVRLEVAGGNGGHAYARAAPALRQLACQRLNRGARRAGMSHA